MPQNQTRVEEANSELNSPQELEHEPAPQSTLSTGARFGQLARRANTTHTLRKQNLNWNWMGWTPVGCLRYGSGLVWALGR